MSHSAKHSAPICSPKAQLAGDADHRPKATEGEIALIVGSQSLAAALEARASDELLTSSTARPLEAGAGAMGALSGAERPLRRSQRSSDRRDRLRRGASSSSTPCCRTTSASRAWWLSSRLRSRRPPSRPDQFRPLNDGGSTLRREPTPGDPERRRDGRDRRARPPPNDGARFARAHPRLGHRARPPAGSPVDVLVNGTLIAAW